ncbi:MAG: hypothetical protein PHV68_05735 [Candidatus Gastranaerophilales bacterium]|nr:hypothetical protein [Candidatus Gastranaerophilales bacterium]
MSDYRRWYDKDPFLKEALELLSLSSEDTKDKAADFILNLQEQVAGDVIERLYETITRFQANGKRWYDKDPIMMRAIELLRVAKPSVQRIAAKKILKALAQDSFEDLETDFSEN